MIRRLAWGLLLLAFHAVSMLLPIRPNDRAAATALFRAVRDAQIALEITGPLRFRKPGPQVRYRTDFVMSGA